MQILYSICVSRNLQIRSNKDGEGEINLYRFKGLFPSSRGTREYFEHVFKDVCILFPFLLVSCSILGQMLAGWFSALTHVSSGSRQLCLPIQSCIVNPLCTDCSAPNGWQTKLAGEEMKIPGSWRCRYFSPEWAGLKLKIQWLRERNTSTNSSQQKKIRKSAAFACLLSICLLFS